MTLGDRTAAQPSARKLIMAMRTGKRKLPDPGRKEPLSPLDRFGKAEVTSRGKRYAARLHCEVGLKCEHRIMFGRKCRLLLVPFAAQVDAHLQVHRSSKALIPGRIPRRHPAHRTLSLAMASCTGAPGRGIAPAAGTVRHPEHHRVVSIVTL